MSHSMPEYAQEIARWASSWLQGEQYFTLHTSGMTGRPKPFVLHRTQLEESARLGMSFLGIPRCLPLVNSLPITHIAGIMQMVRALVYGHDIHVFKPSRDCLSKLHRGQRYGLIALVPLQIQAALRGGFLPRLEQLHTVLIGGAALFPSTEQAIEGLRTRIYHSFGLTETVAHVALRRLHRPAQKYFEALPGVQLRRNKEGCLHIRTPATKYKNIDTQDVIEMKGKGRFVWIGRADSVINSGGVKLYLDELDRQIGDCWLRAVMPSDAYFAYGLPDEELGERLVWFVEQPPTDKQVQCFREHLSQLPLYHRPKSICVSSNFILSPSSKVDKKATAQQPFKQIAL